MVKLGYALPAVAKPVASYIPAIRSGNHVITSGQINFVDGQLTRTGQVGGTLTLEDGCECARVAALNCLAAVKSVIGDLDLVRQVVRVTGFVNSAPGFQDQAKVLNGASDFLLQIFGERGRHTRAAIGTSALPLGAPVEIDLVVEV
ncbi:MAG: RidA family protein [Candidatus Rokubacteria bacterium]|nr:RidA family protein [Candidatus Rokubacteria bacterium]